jgi:hypothetical protein
MMRWLIGALGALLLVPAASRAESESVTSGATTATLSWTGAADSVSGARLAITRSGVVAFDQAIGAIVCDGCALPGNGADDVKLVDLDGLGEPEAIVTGGQVAGFYSFNATSGSYDELRVKTPAGFNLDDLDQDGQTEVVTEDTRFKASIEPPRIFIFTRQDVPLLADVTTKFTTLIKRNAARAKKAKLWDVYVADQYLLGRGRAGLKAVERKLTGHQRRALLAKLKRFGYR